MLFAGLDYVEKIDWSWVGTGEDMTDMPEDGWLCAIEGILLDASETLLLTDEKLFAMIFCSTLGCTDDDAYNFPSSFAWLLLDFSD